MWLSMMAFSQARTWSIFPQKLSIWSYWQINAELYKSHVTFKKGSKNARFPPWTGVPRTHRIPRVLYGLPRVFHGFSTGWENTIFFQDMMFCIEPTGFHGFSTGCTSRTAKKTTGSPKFFLKPCQDLSNKTLKTQFLVLTVKSKEKQCACMEESNIAAAGFRWAIGPGMIGVHGMWCF